MQKGIYFPSQVLQRNFNNHFNKFAVKLLNGEEMVSHLPHEYLRIACYFLARGGTIPVEVSGHQTTINNFVRNGDSLRSDVHLLKKGNVIG